jgi:aspartate/methionine/tyrosine aminotransferase
MPAPYWVTYPAGIDLAGGVTVPVPTDAHGEFKVTVESLEAHRTDKTKLLVFVSPSNPTGAVYSADEARLIGQWAAENDIWVMADEIYQRLSYFTDVAPSIAAVTPRFDNWVLINGVAKSFAMTGWRVGWMIGPKDVVDASARHQSHATSNVANITQMAALAALGSSQESVDQMRDAFNARRKLMYQSLASIPGVTCIEPQGAFYTFPDVTEAMEGRWESSMDLATEMLEESLVATVPGESFGTPGFLRLSYAVGEDKIVEGVDRIARLLAR